MSLTARTKLGSYEVLAPLGAERAADQRVSYFNPLTT